MLDRKFAKSGLIHFDYKKTGWYQTIRNENRTYKYNLIRNTLLLGLGITFFFGLAACFSASRERLPNYLVTFAILSALFILLVRFKKVRYTIYANLVVLFAGLVLSVYAPTGDNANRLFTVIFPLLAIQLRGSRAGSYWFFGYIGFFIFLFVFAYAGILPPWNIAMSLQGFFGQIAGALLVYCFVLNMEMRQEGLIGRLSDHFVFNEATGLPDKDVLIHSIENDKMYLFAIIKIVNFSDLAALFGYEFSDTISLFVSRKLIKFERHFHYKTYQLKYNEYGILIEPKRAMDIASSAQCLTEIVRAIEIEAMPWERDHINLVFRVGGALVMPGDDITLLSKADLALKKAKQGHSVITIFDDGASEKEKTYDYVLKFTDLINNRKDDTFLAVFQPIFTGDGAEIAWYEALLRVKQPDGSYASIYPYLPVAKSTGYYRYLTDYVLRKSAEAIVQYDIDISVNIAIHDIVRPEFLLLVDEAYDMIRDKKGRIIFEILESDELVELDKCLWFIDYVSRYGFKIAIDDFGTGYSNYCSLINLPIDIVKIDGSLIKKIHNDENAKILVEGIVQFCGKSNKKTVAEFVENEAVMASLQSMNIDFLQGYYLAKPGHISSSIS